MESIRIFNSGVRLVPARASAAHPFTLYVAADEFKAELEVSRRHARTTRSRSRRAPLFLRRAGVPVPGGPALVSKKYGDWLKIDLSKK